MKKIETSKAECYAQIVLFENALGKLFEVDYAFEAYLEEFLVTGAAVKHLLHEDLLVWVSEL